MTHEFMQRKLFIGIDLDTQIKRRVSRAIAPWKDLPVKWHKEDSYHIDLITVGWVEQTDFITVDNLLTEISAKMPSFAIKFSQIIARSKDVTQTDPRSAQLVQLVGEESEELRTLYQEIGAGLRIRDVAKKTFRPIVTVGRMRAQKWQELATYPELAIPLPAEMDVTTLTLFESIQVDDTWQFEVVAIYDLQ